MANLIWTGLGGTFDVQQPGEWVDVSTGVAPFVGPQPADTVIIATYPGMDVSAPIINTGAPLAVENFYVYGSAATSLEGVAFGNTYPGLSSGTPIMWMAPFYATGNMFIACGDTGATLMDEGMGFDHYNAWNIDCDMYCGAYLSVTGGKQGSHSKYIHQGDLRAGGGILPLDFPATLRTSYEPIAAATSNFYINEGATPAAWNHLQISGPAGMGGTTNVILNRTTKAVLGALTTQWTDAVVDEFVLNSLGSTATINLLWEAASVGQPIPLGDYVTNTFTLPGLNTAVPSTISTNGGTNNWRFHLHGLIYSDPFYYKGDENAIAEEAGILSTTGVWLQDIREVVGWGDFIDNAPGSQFWSWDSVAWETGATTVCPLSVWKVIGEVSFSGGNRLGFADVSFSCEGLMSTVSQTGLISLETSTGGLSASPIRVNSMTSAAGDLGPFGIIFKAEVVLYQPTNSRMVTIEHTAIVSPNVGLAAPHMLVDWGASVTGAVVSNGMWESCTVAYTPTVGGNNGYVAYHGQAGGTVISAGSGTYQLIGGAGTTHVFNINAPPGGAPLFQTKSIILKGGDMTVGWGAALSEMKLGSFIVENSLGAGSVDFGNLATLWMSGNTWPAGAGEMTIDTTWAGWPTDGIPFVRHMDGALNYNCTDIALNVLTPIKPAVRYLYVEGATSVLTYTQGRIRQLSLTASTTINALQNIRLQPLNGMTAFSDGATSTGMLAKQIDIDLRDVGTTGTAKIESYNTDMKGVVNASYLNCNGATLQSSGLQASTIDIANVVTDPSHFNYLEFIGTESRLATSPTISDPNGNGSGTYCTKISGPIRVLEHYTQPALMTRVQFTGGTLISRNSADTEYRDCILTPTFWEVNTPGAISVQCNRFVSDCPAYIGTTTGHTKTVFEVYYSNAAPVSPHIEAEAAVWWTGGGVTGQSGIATNSLDIAFQVMANEPSQYAIINQTATLGGVIAYTGFGVIADGTKLMLDGDLQLSGPLHYSSTETTWSGDLTHTQQNNLLGSAFIVRGAMGASSLNTRHIVMIDEGDYVAPTPGVFNGELQTCTGWGAFLLDMSPVTTPITFTINTHNNMDATTPAVSADNTTAFQIKNPVGVEVIMNGAGSTKAIRAMNGDMLFTGPGTITVVDRLSYRVVGAGHTAAIPRLLSDAIFMGQFDVEIGDGSTPTTVDYLWANHAPAPLDTYPMQLNIKASAIMRPKLPVTGAQWMLGAGTFDWNSGLVDSDLTFELTINDGSGTHGTNEPLNNSVTILSPNWNLPTYRTIWRFTSRADPIGDLVLPTDIYGDLHLGLRPGVVASYTGAQTYKAPAPNTNIQGELLVDYGDCGYVYKAAVVTGVGGVSTNINVMGVKYQDRCRVFGAGVILNEISLYLKDVDFRADVGSSVTLFVLEMQCNLNTLGDVAKVECYAPLRTEHYYLEGKGSGTTTITHYGDSSVVNRLSATNVHIGTGSTGLLLNDSTGLVIEPINLTLGPASIVNFATANSFWYFTTSGVITDNNVTGTTLDGETIYGTPNLGLIVVLNGTLTLDCSAGANRGMQADLLYMSNATFTTLGLDNRTLYLRGNAGVAALYPQASADNDVSGMSGFGRPTINANGISHFKWPSTDANWCSNGGKDLLVLGQTVDANSCGAFFSLSSTISIGDVTGTALLSPSGRPFEVLNYGAGIRIGKNNAAATTVTHKIRNTFMRGRDIYSNLFGFTNYNGSTKTNRDIIDISLSRFSQEIASSSLTQLQCTANDYCDLLIVDNQWDGYNQGIMVNLYSTVEGNFTFTGNQVSTLATSVAYLISSPNQPGWISTLGNKMFFERNHFSAPNITSGAGLYSVGITRDVIGRNSIHTSSAGTPVDVVPGQNLHLVGWSLPTTNTNIGKSVQASASNYVISEMTNLTNKPTTIISGVLSNWKSLVAYAPNMWKALAASTGPTLTMVHNDSTYRYGGGNVSATESEHLAPPTNPIKIEWTNWEDADPVTVEINKGVKAATGVNNYQQITVTNGQTLDLNTSIDGGLVTCLYWFPGVNYSTDTCAYKNLKITDSVTGSVLFADYQLLKLNTQEEAPSTLGLLEFGIGSGAYGYSGNRSVPTNGQGALSHLYNTPKFQTITMRINADMLTNVPGDPDSHFVASFGAQDIDNQYVYRLVVSLHAVTGQGWTQTFAKIENGVETILASSTKANQVANVTGIQNVVITFDSSTGQMVGSIPGLVTPMVDLAVTNTVFDDGYFGVGVDNDDCDNTMFEVLVQEGDGENDVIFRNTSLIFMPSSKFNPTGASSIVDLRNLIINSNQMGVFPTIFDGGFSPTIVDVSWADARMDEVINNFVQLVGVTMEVDGDIQLVDAGKLWLTGCYITGKNNKRWRIRTEQVNDVTTPALKMEGNLLSGLLTSIRIPGASNETFLLDDPTRNVTVIRVQSDKDIEISRQRVTGLDYDRMVFNGFESRQTTITCACVQNAYVMGMMEKLWREQTLVELISPYCYTYRGKITQFNQRILNPQISASQFVIEVEEWRED